MQTARRHLTRIHKIYAPWLPVNSERMPWNVEIDNETYTICCPLGAAVEIEAAGYKITAHR